jgi:hypothetical protein
MLSAFAAKRSCFEIDRRLSASPVTANRQAFGTGAMIAVGTHRL